MNPMSAERRQSFRLSEAVHVAVAKRLEVGMYGIEPTRVARLWLQAHRAQATTAPADSWSATSALAPSSVDKQLGATVYLCRRLVVGCCY